MDLTYDDLIKQGYIIVGSPQTVAEGYAEYCDKLGTGGVLCAGSPSGPMPNWMAIKNMQMFAEEVMPLFREQGRQTGVPERRAKDRQHQRRTGRTTGRTGKSSHCADSRYG